jgi:hypothetical protein
VVVPLVDLRYLREEAPHVGVDEVVLVLAAVFGQRLGHLALLRRGDVVPDPPVGKGDRRRDRAVGVDGVAAAQVEVGPQPAHRLEDAHPADVGVDAPALTGDVAGPHEPDAGAVPRDGQRPRQRLAGEVVVAGDPYPVEVALAGEQAAQPYEAGEVGVRAEHRPGDVAAAAEVGAGADLDQHLAGTIRAGPYIGGGANGVAALDAVGQHRAAGPYEGRGGAGASGAEGARGGGAKRGGRGRAEQVPAVPGLG